MQAELDRLLEFEAFLVNSSATPRLVTRYDEAGFPIVLISTRRPYSALTRYYINRVVLILMYRTIARQYSLSAETLNLCELVRFWC